MDKRFNNALNECLERLQRGAKVEECLSLHPEMAEELAPMLRIAQSMLTTSHAVRPSQKVREAILEHVIASQKDAGLRNARKPLFLKPWAVALTAFLIVITLGATTTVASASSVPGQPLYPVKMVKEKAQMAFASSNRAKANLHTKLARERTREMEMLAKRGGDEQVEKLAKRVESHLAKSAKLANKDFPQLKQLPVESLPPSDMDPKKWRDGMILRDRIYRDAQYHEARMKDLIEKAPPGRKAQLIRAMERSQQGYQNALEAMGQKRR